MANSVSNLVAIALAVHGVYMLASQGLPARCIGGFLVRRFNRAVYGATAAC